jgi:hypothetical protein
MRAYLLIAAIFLPGLSACSDNKEDNQVTATRMDDLGSLEGTISDDMINTDMSTDEGPYESVVPADVKPEAKAEEKPLEEAEMPIPVVTDEKATTE